MKQNNGKTRKIAAVSAGALAVAIGATFTLATWQDSEWVWGGAAGEPNIGTSVFEVQQNAITPYSNVASAWDDYETSPGDELTFTTGSLSLSPGKSIYASVALRTIPKSLGADVQLQSATKVHNEPATDAQGRLWASLEVDVYSMSISHAAGLPADSTASHPTADCSATGITAENTPWEQIDGITSLSTASTEGDDGDQELGANGTTTEHYCFVLTLPGTLIDKGWTLDDLQGLSIAPAWEFKSSVDVP